ncbi:uncharacterized protein (TIGR02302 family) [Nitrobacter vulgaris]|uniref:TIGR02302 family protein n=1 Tax=Nitrobacter vulgaris TaxID=29421 RepID=UPI002863D361|nr:TIGR02302 family protein [Nitrobacter vulgaris]MDR6303231.1 uncharacterized protein (TIGR02302 family) [Nitrobacter vulgaris]
MSGVPFDPSSQDGDQRELAGLELTRALQRARWVIAWERAWPHVARLLCVGGLFLAVSWAGVWLVLPVMGRAVALAAFVLLAIAAMAPAIRFRWPSREEGLGRLDRSAGLRHRPVTALADTLTTRDPVAHALWQAQRARTLTAIKRLRAGLPSPRLPLHDRWALRSLVMVLMVATYIAADGERTERVAAAFDWNGMLTSTNVRVDAWVAPPPYTGKPPIILSKTNADAASFDGGPLPVPAGSTLTVRSSGGNFDVALGGGVTEKANADKPPEGTNERHFIIAADGTARVRAPAGLPQWTFSAIADRVPAISLAKRPERQARGSLLMSYRLEDDYGVTEAHAEFSTRPGPAAKDGAVARPLFDPPQFALVLPNARPRSGIGQTVKDLSESPYAGAEVTLTLTARDDAGNEGRSEPLDLRLPERVFTKPLARALIEQRRILALDANQNKQVHTALDALLIAPEVFTPKVGEYLGLYSVTKQLEEARIDAQLREVVASLWGLAVSIEDGNITDVEKALRAAQDALKEALERGASDEEIKKLTENLRAALDNYLRQLAEQMRDNPEQLARPLDPNSRVMRPQDLDNMIERMERLSRSGDKDAARQLLDQLQQMLENLQMAQPGQGEGGDLQQSLNELGDMIRKQQQLRDKTYRQGLDSRRDHSQERHDQNAMSGLQRDQQALRDRLQTLQQELAKRGMGPSQHGMQGQSAGPGDDLGQADSAMGQADGRLGEGHADGAVDAQGRALDALRKGARSLAEALQQGEDGPDSRAGRQNGGQTDPLGRPLHGREFGNDTTVKIPGEIDVQRVRRILEELRRRIADPSRPKIELDYIERLLKDY